MSKNPFIPFFDVFVSGLKKSFFVEMTDIQAKSLPYSLKRMDILGAAQTGSGKTLAFLIPVLEMLYRIKWGPQDGLGALIISPTRELVSVPCTALELFIHLLIGSANLRSPSFYRRISLLLSGSHNRRKKPQRRKGPPEPHEHSRRHTW